MLNVQDESSMQKTATKNKRILIIEDEEGVTKPLSLRLRHLGFEVSIAADGMRGLNETRQTFPDLVILDLLLPKLIGEEVCKAIREDENDKVATIPIIMLTGKDSLTDKVIGKVIGANAYLTKPFEFEDLLKEIRQQGLLD